MDTRKITRQGLECPLRNQKGAALAMALLFVAVLALLTSAVIKVTQKDIKNSGAYLQSRSSFYLADAGLNHAVNLMNYDNAGDSPGDATTIQALLTTGLRDSLANVALGDGTYTVQIVDNDDGDGDTATDIDNMIYLVSTGNDTDSTTSIRALVFRSQFAPDSAISTNGDISISGNAKVTGNLGSIHTNGDSSGSGGDSVEQGASASGDCGASVPEGCTSYAMPISLPRFDPTDYGYNADFYLDTKVSGSPANPRVYYNDRSGTTPTIGSGGTYDGVIDPTQPPFGDGTDANDFCNGTTDCNGSWGFGGGTATLTSGSGEWTPAGVYYVNGDVKINGGPYDITVFAEGDINIQGDVNNFQGDNSSTTVRGREDFSNAGPILYTNVWVADTDGFHNFLLVAGIDIAFNAAATNTTGIMSALEHLKLLGNATLDGYMISHSSTDGINETTDSTLANGNSIAGSFTINFDGNIEIPALEDTVTIYSWDECREPTCSGTVANPY